MMNLFNLFGFRRKATTDSPSPWQLRPTDGQGPSGLEQTSGLEYKVARPLEVVYGIDSKDQIGESVRIGKLTGPASRQGKPSLSRAGLSQHTR